MEVWLISLEALTAFIDPRSQCLLHVEFRSNLLYVGDVFLDLGD